MVVLWKAPDYSRVNETPAIIERCICRHRSLMQKKTKKTKKPRGNCGVFQAFNSSTNQTFSFSFYIPFFLTVHPRSVDHNDRPARRCRQVCRRSSEGSCHCSLVGPPQQSGGAGHCSVGTCAQPNAAGQLSGLTLYLQTTLPTNHDHVPSLLWNNQGKIPHLYSLGF